MYFIQLELHPNNEENIETILPSELLDSNVQNDTVFEKEKIIYLHIDEKLNLNFLTFLILKNQINVTFHR